MKFKFFTLLLAFIVVFQTSCKDDPIVGCTTPDAENYNPDAEESDNSCVFARDKFLGEFEGTLLCESPLPDNTEFVMVISEGLSGNNAVEVEFKELDTPIPILSATAEGNMITMEETTQTITIEINGIPLPVEVVINGDGVLNEDGTIFTGMLDIYNSQADITSICNFEATKK